MPIDVVYAKYYASLSLPDGSSVSVALGQHYPAADPVVRAFPDAFSPDPRYGMSYTGEPPGYMALPPGVPIEQATARPGDRRDTPRRG
jgi:hypothetical protein